MTLTAPPRTAPAAAGRPLIETRPLRHPDAGDERVMTRRAWWLVALNVLVPGSAQVLAGNRRLGRFGLGATLAGWALIVVTAVVALLWRQAFIAVATNWFTLTALQILLVGYLVLWVVLTLDTLRLVRLVRLPAANRFAVPVVTLLVLALIGSGSAYAVGVAGASRGALDAIFGQSGPSLPPTDGYYNILLLGADSGDGRDSMRFDSISVVSVNAETGAMTITGIPRDMAGFPFSEGSPMQALYPDGFEGHSDWDCGWGSGVNQLTNAVEQCRSGGGGDLYPDAAGHGSRPAIEATKDAAEGILGIQIPYYVFIDMHHFAALIDALGGVEITVQERLPKGGPPEGWEGGPEDVDEWAFGWIEAGTQVMDGDTAQWYARSRYSTSDFDRMRRQRELQAAILAQFTPDTVLARFSEIAAAGSDMVSTDLPKDKLPEFFDLLLLSREQPITTIELIPENGIDEYDPDWAYIHSLVHEALYPPTPEPTDVPEE